MSNRELSPAATIPEFAGPTLVQGEDEPYGEFLSRQFEVLSDHPGFGWCLSQEKMQLMGINLAGFPVPPKNVLLCLDPETHNLLMFGLPKGMDVFALLEKAKE